MSIGDFGCDFAIFAVIAFFWILDQSFNEGKFFESSESIDEPVKPKPKKLVKCNFEGCASLSFRSTEYCWKHQDGKPHHTDKTAKPNWWEEGGGAS